MCIRDRVGDNLFRMNKKQISQEILHQLPYVESVSILRGLPSTITFQVTEWDAVAQVEVYAQGQTEESGEEGESQQAAAKEAWLISVGGKLLEPVSASHTCLLYTSGPWICPF